MLHATILQPELAADWFSCGIGLLTMFWGMLRPGEWFCLKRSDIMLPFVHRLLTDNYKVLLSLYRPKNQKQMGKSQVSIIENKVCVRWLIWFCEDVDADERLSTISFQRFRVMLKILLRYLELSDDLITPASFRAGAATEAFKKGIELSRIRLMGRWRTITSLDHYVQEAAAVMVSMQLPSDVLNSLHALLSRVRFLRRPPGENWSQLFTRRSGAQHVHRRRLARR
jgi:hypothetical protein